MSRIPTYSEFWPFYVSQHLNATCRALHFVGTTLVMGCVAAAILISPKFLIGALFVGYAFAWIGHFVFEKNRPATFTYPIWSLIADFQMWGYIAAGKMGPEIMRARDLAATRSAAGSTA